MLFFFLIALAPVENTLIKRALETEKPGSTLIVGEQAGEKSLDIGNGQENSIIQ